MQKFGKDFLLALVLAVIPTMLVWLPFYLKLPVFWHIPLPQRGMETIVSNYDGPLYLIVAKSFYNPEVVKSFEFTLPVEYYAAHFPLYPILIRIFSFVFGYPYSMLFITVASSILAIYFFKKLISQYLTGDGAIFATIFFSIFPARWLIVRSIGSAEPLFLTAVIASVYYFKNKQYLFAGLWGAIAAFTKSPGVLLFVVFTLSLVFPELKRIATTNFGKWLRSLKWKAFPILLIPLALLGVFLFYKLTLNDFLAYFHSGDNIHLFFPPFQIFNYSAPWVGTFWLEEIIFIYLFGFLGFVKLVKDKHKELAFFVGIFFTTTIFVSHRDLMRYSLPIVPFLFVAYKDIFDKKEFKYLLAFLVIPVYLFTLTYISQNTMSISNWAPFL